MTTSILLDTVSPSVTFASPLDGGVVAGADGALISVGGSASDDGSGVESVHFENGRGADDAAALHETNWVVPVSPTVSGPTRYRAIAKDAAGNEGSVTIGVVEEAPSGEGMLIRPGVIELTPEQLDDVIAASPDGAHLVLRGDWRERLATRTVIVSPPIPGRSEDGLLRRILDVVFDGASNQTRVDTSLGSLVDVFARLDPPAPSTPEVRGAAATSDPVGLAACEAFTRGRTVAETFEVPPLDVKVAPFVDAHMSLTAAVMADVDVRIRGTSLTGTISGGTMLCGQAEAENRSPFGTVMDAVESGAISIDGPVLPAVQLGPVRIRLTVGASIAPVLDLAAESYEKTEVNFGIETGIELDGAQSRILADPIVNASSGPLRPGDGQSEWGAKFEVGMGLKLQELVQVDLLSGGLSITHRTDPAWTGEPGAPGAVVTSVTRSICSALSVTVGFSVSVGVDIPLANIGFSYTLISVSKEFQVADACLELSRTAAPVEPPVIETAGLPDGQVGVDYEAELSSPDPYVTWQAESALPPGLSLSQDGVLSGVPELSGPYTVRALARGLSGRTTAGSWPIFIAEGVPGTGNGWPYLRVPTIDQTSAGAKQARVSGNGQFVVFTSTASNLVEGDTNAAMDLFVWDTVLGRVTRLMGTGGAQLEGPDGVDRAWWYPAISDDGSTVSFVSDAPNIVSGDDNGHSDVFVWDRRTGEVTRLVGVGGAEPSGDSLTTSISGSGRYVAFSTYADNVVDGLGVGRSAPFIYLWDTSTGSIAHPAFGSDPGEVLIGYEPSVSDDGSLVAFETPGSVAVWEVATGALRPLPTVGGGDSSISSDPVIDGSGTKVAFKSSSDSLVAEEPGDFAEVFVWDLTSDQVARQPMAIDGHPNGESAGEGIVAEPYIGISQDGRFVSFRSHASNLVANDVNGWSDIFVWDTAAGTVERQPDGGDGDPTDSPSWDPAISDDGDVVAFLQSSELFVWLRTDPP